MRWPPRLHLCGNELDDGADPTGANEAVALDVQHPGQRCENSGETGSGSGFEATSMINAEGLVNDGLNKATVVAGPGSSTNYSRITWTYNQGVVRSGLVELGAASHDPTLIVPAQNIASAAISHLVDADGILHDPCEPKCDGNGLQLERIFVRNLVLLNRADPHRMRVLC